MLHIGCFSPVIQHVLGDRRASMLWGNSPPPNSKTDEDVCPTDDRMTWEQHVARTLVHSACRRRACKKRAREYSTVQFDFNV